MRFLWKKYKESWVWNNGVQYQQIVVLFPKTCKWEEKK